MRYAWKRGFRANPKSGDNLLLNRSVNKADTAIGGIR